MTSGGAESHAHADLITPRACIHQEQARHVRTRQQQEHARASKEQPERTREGPGPIVRQGDDPRRAGFLTLVTSYQRFSDDARLNDRHACAETAYDAQEAI